MTPGSSAHRSILAAVPHACLHGPTNHVGGLVLSVDFIFGGGQWGLECSEFTTTTRAVME